MNYENKEELQKLIGPDYQLQWIIGHGGMSTVWLADDVRHEREVALKVLRPEFTANQEFLTRFRNEANSAEGINSPNVVATYDYREIDTEGGFPMCFIAMEYIRGESLADLIAREGQLKEDMALDVLEQAAHGLAVIHRMGLVHRDIKPGNLMITQNGQIKITDFGIAKAAAAVPLTRTGMVVGTAQYVSPEQAQGKKVTAASDVYSLGVVGYEMLAGKRPFTGDSSVSVALAHVSAEPPALPISVSAPARELIELALRKDPTQRFRDGNEMQLAVEQVRQGHRPARPGGDTAVIAVEPSPTASTQMLADMSRPTTVRPAAPRRRPTPPPAPARAAMPAPAQPAPAPAGAGAGQRHGNTGYWIGIVLGVIALAAIGGVAWAFNNGTLGGSTPSSTAPRQSVVTQTTTVETEPTYEAPTEEPTTHAPDTPTERSRHDRHSSVPATLTIEDETPTQPTQRQTHARPSAPEQQPTEGTSINNEAPTTQAPSPQPGGGENGLGELDLPNLPNILGGNA